MLTVVSSFRSRQDEFGQVPRFIDFSDLRLDIAYLNFGGSKLKRSCSFRDLDAFKFPSDFDFRRALFVALGIENFKSLVASCFKFLQVGANLCERFTQSGGNRNGYRCESSPNR